MWSAVSPHQFSFFKIVIAASRIRTYAGYDPTGFACDHFLRTSSHNTIPTGTLCDLIRMILTMNNFSFNDNHYLQIHGTAMGTKMTPSFANLFLGFFEANALKNAPFQPHTWFRYIDDIFRIWTEGL